MKRILILTIAVIVVSFIACQQDTVVKSVLTVLAMFPITIVTLIGTEESFKQKIDKANTYKELDTLLKNCVCGSEAENAVIKKMETIEK